MLIDIWIRCPQSDVDFYTSTRDCFARNGANLMGVGPEVVPPSNTHRRVYGGMELFMAFDADPVAETERLVRDWLTLEKQVEATSRKLNNPAFVKRAPPNIVQTTRDRLAILEAEQMCIKVSLNQLRDSCKES